MAFKHKYSYYEKERILIEYLNGTHELCLIQGMNQGALKDEYTIGLKIYSILSKMYLTGSSVPQPRTRNGLLM